MTKKHRTISFHGIPRPQLKWLLGTAVLSVILHLISYINLEHFNGSVKRSSLAGKSNVKISVVKKPKKKPLQKDFKEKAILETKLEPTAKPAEARFHGAQDHIAKKETKTRHQPMLNDLDPGAGGAHNKSRSAQTRSSPKPEKPQAKTRQLFGEGPVGVQKKKSKYQSLLPSATDLAKQVQAGYQDYVDDEVEIGERVDFNTTSYRYIGYFTNLRKGFSQTWVYPSEAVKRGIQGQVRIEFTIERDGQLRRVKILETSGHKILDDAVVDAIKLSSPYPPLPEDHEKDRLTVVANFVYTLRGYAF